MTLLLLPCCSRGRLAWPPSHGCGTKRLRSKEVQKLSVTADVVQHRQYRSVSHAENSRLESADWRRRTNAPLAAGFSHARKTNTYFNGATILLIVVRSRTKRFLLDFGFPRSFPISLPLIFPPSFGPLVLLTGEMFHVKHRETYALASFYPFGLPSRGCLSGIPAFLG